MNEITNIHLDRQSFTIAVDAYKSLQDYLHAIKRQVVKDADDVLLEVELRMAELLRERGITGDKVVLQDDVEYLKRQLGEPGDFGETDADTSTKTRTSHEESDKRLFRDLEHGMVAGVSAGLATYLGIDVLIIRLVFVALTLAGTTGIWIYILLWLLVPAARSGSDRLQMRGQAVTVENIKKTVDQADVASVAIRTSKTMATIVEKVFGTLCKVVLAIIGIGFIIAGIGLLLGGIAAASYLAARGVQLAGELFFPLGGIEWLAVVCALGVVSTMALTGILVGRSMIRRKWSVAGWVIAALIGTFVLSGGIGVASVASIVPDIDRRYSQSLRTEWRPTTPFKNVNLEATDLHKASVPVRFESQAGKYGIEIHSISNVDTAQIMTKMDGDVLTINVDGLQHQSCSLICPYGNYNVELVIYTPEFNRKTMGNYIDSGMEVHTFPAIEPDGTPFSDNL